MCRSGWNWQERAPSLVNKLTPPPEPVRSTRNYYTGVPPSPPSINSLAGSLISPLTGRYITPFSTPSTSVNLFANPYTAPPPRTYSLFVSHAWGYSDEYERFVGLLKQPGLNFSWKDRSIPKTDPVRPHPTLNRSARRVFLELEKRISESDCVLVLSGMYCAHSDWIHTEIDSAQEHGKPIIAVVPLGQGARAARGPERCQRRSRLERREDRRSRASASSLRPTADSKSTGNKKDVNPRWPLRFRDLETHEGN